MQHLPACHLKAALVLELLQKRQCICCQVVCIVYPEDLAMPNVVGGSVAEYERHRSRTVSCGELPRRSPITTSLRLHQFGRWPSPGASTPLEDREWSDRHQRTDAVGGRSSGRPGRVLPQRADVLVETDALQRQTCTLWLLRQNGVALISTGSPAPAHTLWSAQCAATHERIVSRYAKSAAGTGRARVCSQGNTANVPPLWSHGRARSLVLKSGVLTSNAWP